MAAEHFGCPDGLLIGRSSGKNWDGKIVYALADAEVGISVSVVEAAVALYRTISRVKSSA